MIKVYKYTENLTWCSGPLLHGLRSLLGLHHATDELIDWTRATLQIMDDGTEVGGLRIT